jgi:hypothetical protein
MINNLSVPRTYAAGAAFRYLENLLRRGQITFSLAALMEATGLTRIAARNQLLRLGPRVTRVAPRQDFFLIVSPEHQVMGAPPATWWLDAYFQWLDRPYYLALQSAAAEYGSMPQAIQVVQVITDRPSRPLVLGRIRVEFHVKQTVTHTPIQPLANAYAPLRVSTPAATVLDLLRYAPSIGGLERAAETAVPLLPKLRRTDLIEVLKTEPERATVNRAAVLFRDNGYPALADLARVKRSSEPRHKATGTPTDRSSKTNREIQ